MSAFTTAQVAGFHIQQSLQKSTDSYQVRLEQLSSGSKFTSIGDDTMGITTATKLQIAMNFNSRISSSIAMGTDMLACAEGYQSEIISNIQRIRDLTVQAGNFSYSDSNKDEILTEIAERLDYINEIVDTASFNGAKLLDGTSLNTTILTGKAPSDIVNIGSTFIDSRTTALGIDLPAGVTGENWTSDQIQNYLTSLDNATSTLLGNIGEIGAYTCRFDDITDKLTGMSENLASFKSDISDVDVAEASADMVKYQILQQISTSIFVQANDVRQLTYSLFNASS